MEGETFSMVCKEGVSQGYDTGLYARESAKRNKGNLGSLVEFYHFGYKPNSSQLPDFPKAGVELKTTPFRRKKDGSASAKERLVVTLIDFFKILDETFDNSHFWLKAKLILLVCYEFERQLPKLDYTIRRVRLFSPPKADLPTIMRDWETIRDKIDQGRAHEPHCSDTIYIEACPKGANGRSFRPQPKSPIPAMQRGRDFSIMLTCLRDLGYGMEWRVVNAAEYGAAQRRRRVFMFAWRTDTRFGQTVARAIEQPERFLAKSKDGGFMAKAFPCKAENALVRRIDLPGEIGEVSSGFSFEFGSAGFMLEGKVFTLDVTPRGLRPTPLSEVLENGNFDSFEIEGAKFEKFKYLKGAKRIRRKSASGHEYVFSEGAIPFPEPLDLPSRTMLTSEGSLNRSTHVIQDPISGKFRLLTPVEAERL